MYCEYLGIDLIGGWGAKSLALEAKSLALALTPLALALEFVQALTPSLIDGESFMTIDTGETS